MDYDDFELPQNIQRFYKNCQRNIEREIDAIGVNFPNKVNVNGSRGKRRITNDHYKHHLQKLAQNAWFPSGAMFVNEDGYHCNENDPDMCYIKRYYRGKRSKDIKRHNNRKFRRSGKYKYISGKPSTYRKCTGFWWEYI